MLLHDGAHGVTVGGGGFELGAGFGEPFLGGGEFGGYLIVSLSAEPYRFLVRPALDYRLLQRLVVALEELIARAELADEDAPALHGVDQPLLLEDPQGVLRGGVGDAVLGLQVAGGPVVEQAVAGDMLAGLGYRDRVTQLVAAADEDAEFQLIIETPARSILRDFGVGRLALASRADHGVT